MDNLRRRNTKDVENAHKFGIEKFVTELLPVLDSMALGLAVEDASAESLREGMELTMNMLQKMMEKLNIEEIDPLNEKFDPEKHQAMTMQPNADVEPNTVIAVMQKGYSLNDRLDQTGHGNGFKSSGMKRTSSKIRALKNINFIR